MLAWVDARRCRDLVPTGKPLGLEAARDLSFGKRTPSLVDECL